VHEKRVLRRMFGPKREGWAGGWRRLHNEEFHNLYPSQYIIRVVTSWRIRWARYVAWMGEMRNAYNILVGKPEGKRLLGRSRHIQEDNIRMDAREIGWECVGWLYLAQDRDQ
jgi:hypothetical protein